MTTTMSETTLWQRNLASLIRSGLFSGAEVIDSKGLHAVVGIYGDGSHSAPLAKYGNRFRAEDAVTVVRQIAEPRPSLNSTEFRPPSSGNARAARVERIGDPFDHAAQAAQRCAADQVGSRKPPRGAGRAGLGPQPLCRRSGVPTSWPSACFAWFRYSWTNCTAIAPSPTAEATLLTEPDRTSPAAKTPGRLASSRNGGRSRRPEGRLGEGRPGQDEPLGVALDLRRQPVGPRLGSDEAEQRRRPQRPDLPRLLVDKLDLAEVSLARRPVNLGVAEHLDPGMFLDPPGQVGGHILVEVVASDHQVDLPHPGGEEDGGLTGGVAAADDHHLRPLAHLGLDGRGGVVDAAALELPAPFHRKSSVVGPGGDQHAPRRDGLSAVELDHREPPLERQAHGLGRDGDVSPELVRLHEGALRQLASRDPGREAQVVLDPHAPTSLSPGGPSLQHHRPQPLRRAVDRRREPRRPGPGHDQVVHPGLQRPAEAEGLREIAV